MPWICTETDEVSLIAWKSEINWPTHNNAVRAWRLEWFSLTGELFGRDCDFLCATVAHPLQGTPLLKAVASELVHYRKPKWNPPMCTRFFVGSSKTSTSDTTFGCFNLLSMAISRRIFISFACSLFATDNFSGSRILAFRASLACLSRSLFFRFTDFIAYRYSDLKSPE